MSLKSTSTRVKLVTKTEVVCPNDTNPMGILQGGRLVQWMDIAAAVCAQNHAGTICVTVSIDRVNFRRPARVGDTLTIEAGLTKVSRTSMNITVTAHSASIGQTVRQLISEAEFIFVAIDSGSRPVPVPSIRQVKQHRRSKARK